MKGTADFKELPSRRVRSLIANSARGRDVLFLQGRVACMQLRSLGQIKSLEDVEFRVFSQFGEDGIIEWLVQHLDLPTNLRSFVEFGVERYEEANTRFLIENRNWRGLIMDGDPGLRGSLERDPLFWRHDLSVTSSFITRENINQLITDAGFTGDVGLLSIDIDGNDYWIWEKLEAVQPIILISEYNAVFGDIYPISIPYDPQFIRHRAHSSGLYFGASIQALRYLATRRGYTFIGTTSAGNNAFFVRDDYAQKILGKIEGIIAYGSRTRESRNPIGELSFVGGRKRFDLIAALEVTDVRTGDVITLRDMGNVYSSEWT